ncbi:multidrug effflux MFS transporter [Hydrogenophaga sp. SL48]|uniref:multidrug effflux MFS transporter n=1 Tax=Hydrogenophaga sp. SL48 TaxID=2806347 RepID=UPI001F318F42|nr:multidrug effflux MFS transporter [Hydrogenophaga sp. SL48]UJW81581.1 multidrug effflux MFS transporter [Hydrogenophaga sp. SL48]
MTSSPPKAAPHGLLIANLLSQLAFGLLAMTICLPSMQEWGAIFGSSQAAVQLTFSGFVVTYGSLQLLYGPFSDRIGRKKILMFGLAVSFVGSVLAALAPSLPLLVAARVLQGAGAAAGMVVGRAMVQDLFDGPERTRVMAYVGMAMGLCPPLATIIGGQLHVRLGWQANFVLMAGLAAVLFVAAWRGLPDHRKATTVQPHWLRAMLSSYARLAREPSFLLHVLLLAMTTATFYAFLGGAPIVLGSYGVKPDGIGFYIMAIPGAYIVGNYLTSRFARLTGERRIMRFGQVLTVGGIALMLLLALAGLNTPLAFALPLVLLGIGHGLLVPPALAGTVGLLPALAGSAAAVAGLSQQLMGAVGGFAVGLFHHEGAVNLGWLMLGLTLCGTGAQWLLHRRKSP